MRSGKSPDDLLLLAIMVIGNFERALVGFKDQRLVTEGVIHLNALICIVILLTADRLLVPGTAVNQREPVPAHGDDSWRWGRGRPSSRCWSTGQSCAALYGDRFAGHAGLSIRFGPNATTWGPGR